MHDGGAAPPRGVESRSHAVAGQDATPPEGLRPPVPARRPHVVSAHGDDREDDWYWLRTREDPEVLAHLRAENDYAEAVLAPLEPLRLALFEEIKARIVETDLTVPVRRGPWWYYQRTEEGRDYPVHCRRPVAGDAPPMDVAAGADETVLLDENTLQGDHDYLAVANLSVSPDHRRLAYAVDTSGGERYELSFRALDADPSLDAPETVSDTSYGIAWAADNATVFYTRTDDAMRPFQVWRHRLDTSPDADTLVFEEGDERFTVGVGRTKDDAYVVVAVQSNTTSECWVIPADDPLAAPRVIEGRRQGVEYSFEHHRAGGAGSDGRAGWFVMCTNDAAEDFRVVATEDRAEGPGAPTGPEVPRVVELVPHRPGVRVDDVDVFDSWLVVSERAGGEPMLRIAPIPEHGVEALAGGAALATSRTVVADRHPSATWEGPNPEPGARQLRIGQTSLVTPQAVLDVDLATGTRTLRKRQPVLGGYDPSAYRTFRLWAPAPDATLVPLSIVHRADLLGDPGAPDGTPPARPAPCLLYGYGAYEHSIDPVFSSVRLSLLDRGVVFAIAHVRGGGELGRRWYTGGKLAAKPNTVSDFIACARHLIDTGFTEPELLAARGGSAGGLLMGAIVNDAPELFAAVVAEVPFVDCLTTMLDESLPLTIGEFEEWGDPIRDPDAYATIKSYSPYDNVAPVGSPGGPPRRPRLFVTAGLNDPRVGYWEPAKWVAKLRDTDPAAEVVLRTELGAGHGGRSGRYDSWRDEALVQAFVLDALGVARAP